MTYKLGDVVKLKSGGPAMTVVSEAGNDNKIDCQWFNEDRSRYELANGRFDPSALTETPSVAAK
ncbi:YodC family protein [Pelagibacterium luteolum]|uniref:Uncharacterized small protein n=1 Tax=Pelagibacterium luteolum TaxID=440168 RepID=A0A1G8ALB8_9HYPH|nr:DUF2158 domain-containing protein [Pelagibacterium luteolum]SDH21751.1 Uncharacterized small protein [Pelagibacterium luteolum]